MSVPEHQRIIPAFDISEEGLRQLEIWLRDRLGQGGSGWRFLILNGDPTAKPSERGWAYVRFTECFDLDLVPDPTDTGGNWGAAFLDSSGCGLLIGSDTATLIKTNGGDLSLLADGGNVSIFANTGDVGISAFTGDITVSILSAGKSLIVKDSGGDPIFRVDENGDLHGKTGKALTFDL